MTLIPPTLLQIGDPVIIAGEEGTIRSIDGPDTNGTFDIYLNNNLGGCHKVVNDSVQLVSINE